MAAAFLADTSAWAHARRHGAPDDVRDEFSSLLVADRIATSGVVRWELLHSTNNLRQFRARRRQLASLFTCPLGEPDVDWALDVCEALDERHGGNSHRAVKLPDALVAAAAFRAGLPVLHYDADFDRIAEVTGLESVWIRPRGTL